MAFTGANLKRFLLRPWGYDDTPYRVTCLVCKHIKDDILDAELDTHHCNCVWDGDPHRFRRLDDQTRRGIITWMMIAKRANMPRDVARLLAFEVGRGCITPMTSKELRRKMRRMFLPQSLMTVQHMEDMGMIPAVMHMLLQMASAFVAIAVIGGFSHVAQTIAPDASLWVMVGTPLLASVLASVFMWAFSLIRWG